MHRLQPLRTTTLALTLAAVPTAVVPTLASAQYRIDQQQTDTSLIAGFYLTNGSGLGQTITPAAVSLVGAGAYISVSPGVAGNQLTASLYQSLNPSTGGTFVPSGLLATGSVGLPARGGSLGWVDVFWATPVGVTPGSQYFLLFTSTATEASGGYGLAMNGVANPAPYPGGQLFLPTGSGSGAFLPYSTPPLYDLAFRTYTVASTVPEPATVALVGAGLAALALGAARRRTALRS